MGNVAFIGPIIKGGHGKVLFFFPRWVEIGARTLILKTRRWVRRVHRYYYIITLPWPNSLRTTFEVGDLVVAVIKLVQRRRSSEM